MALGCLHGPPRRHPPEPLPPTAAAPARLPLWEVRGPGEQGGTLHLLGSTHARRTRVRAMDPAIESAYERAQGLIVEIDVLEHDPVELNQLMVSTGYLSDGSTVRDRLDPETYDDLQRAFEELSLPSEALEHFKPWFVALSLQARALAGLGYDPEYGVDLYFLNKAKPEKPVVALETAQDQLDLFTLMTPEMQVLMLRNTLDDLDDLGDLEEWTEARFAAWETGDIEAMQRLLLQNMVEEPELRPYFERVIFQRNLRMTDQLEAYLRPGQRWFAVVGFAHLIAAEGIPALLSARGYSVRQMTPAAAEPPSGPSP